MQARFDLVSPALGAACAAAGLVFALWLYPSGVFDPSDSAWLMWSDSAQHFLGWRFFRQEPWLWPPGRLESYGLEMGSSIVFTDSIPLLALALKAVGGALPADLQYTGWWVAACHALAGAFAWRCGWRATGRIEAGVACALFAIVSPIVVVRFQSHYALMAHWLVWWSLGDCLAREVGSKASRVVSLAIAALVHAYLLVVVAAVVAADVLRRTLVTREWRWGEAATLVAVAGVVLPVVLWMSGYFVLGAAEGGADAYGRFGAHLGTLWNPIGGSPFVDGYAVAPDSALERSVYLGFGALVLLIPASIALVRSRDVRRIVAGQWPLIAACVVLGAVATTHRVHYADRLLFELPLPSGVHAALSTLRASGRLLWLVYYALVAGAVIAVALGLQRRYALTVLGGAVLLQIVDLSGFYGQLRHEYAAMVARQAAANPHFVGAFWGGAAGRYTRVLVAPMEHAGPHWVPLARYAAEHRLAINVGQFARASWPRFQSAHERVLAELASGTLRPDALYVVTRPDEIVIGPLAAADLRCVLEGLVVIAPRARGELSCDAPARRD